MSLAELPDLASAFSSASNDMLAAILDQSADCIKVIGPGGTVDYMNRNGQCAMEVDDFCAIAGQSWTSLWPAEAAATLEAAMAAAREGKLARFEAFCPTAKGAPRWWDVSVSPLLGADGALRGYIATSRDISDRVHMSELREAIADEMRHRLRNHFVVVGSILSAHARGNPEREAFVRDMVGRLNALGMAQTLKTGDGESCALATLVPALVEGYATPDCPIRVGALPEVALDQAQADAIALLLGELAVNSTKHGALSANGRVTLDARIDDGQLVLAWSERSDRPVTARAREGGQGFRLINRVLASRGGDFAIAWRDDGVDATARLAIG